MTQVDEKLRHLIMDYLSDEGILKEKIPDPKLDFGYQFYFPPGVDPQGRQRGQVMAVYKPINKDILIFSIGTQIADVHVNALNASGENRKMQFFVDLRKVFLMKDVFFRIDIPAHRFEISDQIFVDNSSNLSKNSFFKSVRKVFNAAAYSNILLGEYCSGKVKAEDVGKSKDFDSGGSGFSLYT